MVEELKDYEKRLYAVKSNLEKMSEYTGIVKRLARECQAVTEDGNSYRVAYGTNGYVVSFYPID